MEFIIVFTSGFRSYPVTFQALSEQATMVRTKKCLNSSSPARKYKQKLSTMSFVIHVLLYPDHLTLVDLSCLVVVSKEMKRRLNERKEISHFICAKIGLPEKRGIKFLTLMNARASQMASKSNPVSLANHKDCLRSWLTDDMFKLTECCAICLHTDYNDLEGGSNRTRAYEYNAYSMCVFRIGKHLRYNTLCHKPECHTGAIPSWQVDATKLLK